MTDVEMLSVEEFDDRLAAGGWMLCDFFADWCGPCKRMAPVVERLAEAFDGRVTVAKVNVDDAPELAERYGIQSIPMLILFHDGEPAADYIGVRSFEELEGALNAQL